MSAQLAAALREADACPGCQGSGTVCAMTSHLGPDDYEFDEECAACNGTGSADIRVAINALGYQWHTVKPHTEMVSRAKVLQIIAARDALAAAEAQPVAQCSVEVAIGADGRIAGGSTDPTGLPMGIYKFHTAPPAQPAAPAGWISVEDRMPEPDTGEVLVWLTGGCCHIDEWHTHREDPTGMSTMHTLDMGCMWRTFDYEDITHWMPLPAAPGGALETIPTPDVSDSDFGAFEDAAR